MFLPMCRWHVLIVHGFLCIPTLAKYTIATILFSLPSSDSLIVSSGYLNFCTAPTPPHPHHHLHYI